jgi:hypothetical protein
VNFQRPSQIHRLARPQSAAQLQSLDHAPNLFLPGHVGGGEFRSDVRIILGNADPEDDPSLADLIEGRNLLSHQNRVAQRR